MPNKLKDLIDSACNFSRDTKETLPSTESRLHLIYLLLAALQFILSPEKEKETVLLYYKQLQALSGERLYEKPYLIGIANAFSRSCDDFLLLFKKDTLLSSIINAYLDLHCDRVSLEITNTTEAKNFQRFLRGTEQTERLHLGKHLLKFFIDRDENFLYQEMATLGFHHAPHTTELKKRTASEASIDLHSTQSDRATHASVPSRPVNAKKRKVPSTTAANSEKSPSNPSCPILDLKLIPRKNMQQPASIMQAEQIIEQPNESAPQSSLTILIQASQIISQQNMWILHLHQQLNALKQTILQWQTPPSQPLQHQSLFSPSPGHQPTDTPPPFTLS